MNTPVRNLLLLLALQGLIWITPLLGETISHEEGGIRFDIPDGWQAEIDEDLLIISDPAGDVSIYFFVSELQIVEHFTPALGEEIAEVITEPEVVSEKVQAETNGLFRFSAEGYGLHEGEIVDWDLTFLAGARKSMIIIALGAIEDHRTQVDAIYSSIQPVEPIAVEEPSPSDESPGSQIEAPR